MPMFEQLNETSSGLKIKFDTSLDRSWCEFFKIIKDHGPLVLTTLQYDNFEIKFANQT